MPDYDETSPLQCCICGAGVKWAEAFGMTLFPALDPEPFQQWYAHPRCISNAMRGQFGPLRPEIEAMWPDDYYGRDA